VGPCSFTTSSRKNNAENEQFCHALIVSKASLEEMKLLFYVPYLRKAICVTPIVVMTVILLTVIETMLEKPSGDIKRTRLFTNVTHSKHISNMGSNLI